MAQLAGIAVWAAAVGRELTALGSYAFTVLVGLAVHGVITLPLVLWFATRRNPLRYANDMSESLVTAFGVTMQGVLDRWLGTKTDVS